MSQQKLNKIVQIINETPILNSKKFQLFGNDKNALEIAGYSFDVLISSISALKDYHKNNKINDFTEIFESDDNIKFFELCIEKIEDYCNTEIKEYDKLKDNKKEADKEITSRDIFNAILVYCTEYKKIIEVLK